MAPLTPVDHPELTGDDTKVVILCGGRGTRMGADARQIPKPMLPIGGHPILWHVMAGFGRHGHRDFVLALGWLGHTIRQWVLQMRPLVCDFTIDVATGRLELLDDPGLDGWRITCIDTGRDTQTGGRVLHVVSRVDADRYVVAYGDSLGNVDVGALVRFHRSHGKAATVTAVHPPSRWGVLDVAVDGTVRDFQEKPRSAPAVNGGYIVIERQALAAFDYRPELVLERDLLPAISRAGQLVAYRHPGYWAAMDTPAERDELERLWATGKAPWLD